MLGAPSLIPPHPFNPWPFDPLQPLSYGCIMADPAWSFKNFSAKGKRKSADAHYECMSLDDIKTLPVGHLAAPDCWLWLWATNPMLPHALETMKAWGFTYVTAGTWHKRTVRGNTAFGTGYVLRCSSEPFLIGKIGSPKAHSRSVRTILEGRTREHSRKPDEAYQTAEQLFGPVRRVDLFSRQSRPGWDAFGFEAGKFDEVPA